MQKGVNSFYQQLQNNKIYKILSHFQITFIIILNIATFDSINKKNQNKIDKQINTHTRYNHIVKPKAINRQLNTKSKFRSKSKFEGEKNLKRFEFN